MSYSTSWLYSIYFNTQFHQEYPLRIFRFVLILFEIENKIFRQGFESVHVFNKEVGNFYLINLISKFIYSNKI